MSADTAPPRAADPPTVAAQYEALRRAALGEPLPPDARHGLLLFLRRGMWAWTQALAIAANAPRQPTRSPASVSPSPYELNGIIQVFAAMTLSFNHRSTQ